MPQIHPTLFVLFEAAGMACIEKLNLVWIPPPSPKRHFTGSLETQKKFKIFVFLAFFCLGVTLGIGVQAKGAAVSRRQWGCLPQGLVAALWPHGQQSPQHPKSCSTPRAKTPGSGVTIWAALCSASGPTSARGQVPLTALKLFPPLSRAVMVPEG